jgi:NAD(P)-dependent dehydrogenase (short-subunit alcohol dehydrogenase family)
MAENGYVGGKVIVVTGGGGGFGRLISQQAGERGARMVCADINIEAAEETVALVRSAGGKAVAFKADVTSAEDMVFLAEKAVETFGQIDVMINNAGIMPLAFFADHKEAMGAWHRCIDINFRGVLNGMVAVHDQMLSQGRGHIINISSIYGNFPVVGAGLWRDKGGGQLLSGIDAHGVTWTDQGHDCETDRRARYRSRRWRHKSRSCHRNCGPEHGRIQHGTGCSA